MISKIRFYKNGLAYFEHEIPVNQNKTNFELLFKREQMNDILKSLTVVDPTGSSVPIVSYESKKSGAKILQEIPINLSREDVLSNLLTQIKGTQIKISLPSRTVQGRIIGIETKLESSSTGQIEKKYLTLLTKNGEMQAFNLFTIKSIKILSDEINRDVKDILDVSVRALKKNLRTVSISLLKKGKTAKKRDIVASYVTEAPLWKTTYRLILDKNKSFIIQGWVIIENTTEENWKDVEVSLIAGKPVSFRYEMYQPYYVGRPYLAQREQALEIPEAEEESVDDKFGAEEGETLCADTAPAAPKDTPSGLVNKLSRAVGGGRSKQKEMTTVGQSTDYGALRKQSLKIKTGDVGELFEFNLGKLSLRKNNAAMVPILASKLTGEKLSLFNESNLRNNPMHTLRIKNNSGIVLDGGPATIIDSGAYSGEGFLKTLQKNEEVYLPYAADGEIYIETTSESKDEGVFREEKVGKYIYEYFYRKRTKTYNIKNKSSEKKLLYIDHPRFAAASELVKPKEPEEKTESYYRFRLEVKPNTSRKFEVVEKLETYRSRRRKGWFE